MRRREILFAGAAGLMLPFQATGAVTALQPLLPPLESFPIWPKGRIPGSDRVGVREDWILRNPDAGNPNDTAVRHVTEPILMVRRPRKPNGAAVLMIPGGGYVRVAVSRAGGDNDSALADQGVTVFIMTYRLPADGWGAGPRAPLQDAQRAIRLIRHRAADFGLDPQRVGVIGASAGGHLAGWLSESYQSAAYEAVDAVDTQPIRPQVTALFYPVVTLLPPFAHAGSLKNLFPNGAGEADLKALSLEHNLPADMPPTFLAHAADDATVPVENSQMLFDALRKNKTPSELHVFEAGGHALRVDNRDQPYLALYTAFARRHGLW